MIKDHQKLLDDQEYFKIDDENLKKERIKVKFELENQTGTADRIIHLKKEIDK